MNETCGTYGRENSSIHGFGEVGTASHCKLDGPGIESLWGEIFHTRPDGTCVPPGLPYDGYRVSFQEVNQPGRGPNLSSTSGVLTLNKE